MRIRHLINWSQILWVGLLFSLVVIPLWIIPGFAELTEFSKTFLAQMVSLSLLGWMMIGLLTKQWRLNRDLITQNRSVQFFLCALLLAAISWMTSSVLALNPRWALLGGASSAKGSVHFLTAGIFLFPTLIVLRQPKRWESLVNFLIGVGALVSLLGLLQFYGVDLLSLRLAGGQRASITFGNPIPAAAYLILIIPITLYRFLTIKQGVDRGRASRGFLLLALSLQISLLIMTGSRGPTLGLIFACLFIMGYLVARFWSRPYPIVQTPAGGKTALSLFGVTIALALVFRVTPVESMEDLPLLNRLINFDISDGSSEVRTKLWEASVELMTADQPVGAAQSSAAELDQFHFLRWALGYGPENQLMSLASVYPPEVFHLEGNWLTRAHNHTFDTLIARGTFGLITDYLLLILLMGIGMRSLFHSIRPLQWIAVSSGAGMLLGMLVTIWLKGESEFGTWLGLAIPIGALAGMLAGWIYSLLAFHDQLICGRKQLLITFLLAAILADFLADQFAYSSATTTVYGWVYTALILGVSFPQSLFLPGTADSHPLSKWSVLATLFILIGTIWAMHQPFTRIKAAIAYENGKSAYRQDDIRASIDHHQSAIAYAPLMDAGHRHLAYSYLRLAHRTHLTKEKQLLYDTAFWHAERALQLNPYHPENSYRLGRLEERLPQSQFASAASASLEHMRIAITLAPTHVTYRNALARTLLEQQQPSEALTVLKEALQADSTYAATWMLLGDCYLVDGDWINAQVAHRKGLSMLLPTDGPTAGLFYHRDGRMALYGATGRTDEYQNLLEATIQHRLELLHHPNPGVSNERVAGSLSRALLLMGESYYVNGDSNQALHYFEEAYQYRRKSYLLKKRLADLYLNREEYQKAQAYYQLISKEYDHDIPSKIGLAQSYSGLSEYDLAVQAYQQVLKISPEHFQAHKQLAFLYRHQRQYDQSLAFALKALVLSPEEDQTALEALINELI